MKIPENSKLIDSKTVALFNFNGTIHDECGNYNSFTYADRNRNYYTVPGFNIKALSNDTDVPRLEINNLATYLKNNDFTLDFMAYIKGESGGYIIGLTTELSVYSDNSLSYYSTNGSIKCNIASYIGEEYHHYAISHNGSTAYIFIDGIKKAEGNVQKQFYQNPLKIFESGTGTVRGKIRIFNLRVSSLRWINNFSNPYDDLFYTVKEKDDNVYGLI